jgi:predicted ester cyclase
MADSELREWYLRYAAAVTEHRFDDIHEFIDDKVTAYGVTYTRDQVIDNFRAITDAVPDMSWEVTELLFDRDGIASRAINRGTPVKEWLGVKPTGRSFEVVEFTIYKVADGKFTHMNNLHDSSEIKRQLTA